MADESNKAPEQGDKSPDKKAKENKAERALRTKQLRQIRAAIRDLDASVGATRDANRARKALLSHLRTFYSELSQIAKGKGMILLQVPELMVTQINNAIADAKNIITGDVYLDRVKQFISAGTPPTFSEVLVIAKTVEEVLTRHDPEFETRSSSLQQKLTEAYTIETGIECSIDDLEHAVRRESVEERMDDPDDDWFLEDEDGEELFDLERLDNLDLDTYFTAVGEKESDRHDDQEEDVEGNEDHHEDE